MLKKRLGNCLENCCWKECLGSCVENCCWPQPAAACLPFPFPLKLLHALSHFDELSRFVCFDVCCEMSLFTRFDTFWWNVAIYALWRMSAKCRDLRTLPGTKFRLPGTFNYSAPLLPKKANRIRKLRIPGYWVHDHLCLLDWKLCQHLKLKIMSTFKR